MARFKDFATYAMIGVIVAAVFGYLTTNMLLIVIAAYLVIHFWR